MLLQHSFLYIIFVMSSKYSFLYICRTGERNAFTHKDEPLFKGYFFLQTLILVSLLEYHNLDVAFESFWNDYDIY